MPETVIESVFEDLRANHPLLSAINFIPATGRVRMLVNTNGRQEAQWGDLCDEIVKELLAGFKEIDSGLMKLTASCPCASPPWTWDPSGWTALSGRCCTRPWQQVWRWALQ